MMDGIRKSLKVSLLTETFPPEVNGVSFTLAHLARGLCAMGSQVEVLRPARKSVGKDDEPWERGGSTCPTHTELSPTTLWSTLLQDAAPTLAGG